MKVLSLAHEVFLQEECGSKDLNPSLSKFPQKVSIISDVTISAAKVSYYKGECSNFPTYPKIFRVREDCVTRTGNNSNIAGHVNVRQAT